MSASSDDSADKDCPLCMEPFDFDDVNFYPCRCQYQICRFCWHRLRTDENGLCPACRQPYPENPVTYEPISSTELQKIKSKSKAQNKNGKTKPADSRKHLSNYRVLQKNLVYVVGLSQKLADVDVLKKPEFFGRFGKILKVAVGSTSILNNVGQQTSCTAYVTYSREEDALRAIEAVNNAILDGRLLKASLGTTKYCSTFLRGQICHKAVGGKMDCMYLHKIAEPEASFTKEDMHAGKHTEYERKLHEQLAARTQDSNCTTLDSSRSPSSTVQHQNKENDVDKRQMTSAEKEDSIKQDNDILEETEINHSEPENLSESETNSSESDIPETDYIVQPIGSKLSRPLPENSTVPTEINTSEQSSKNKFTTCEEFERMLMMESKEETSSKNNGSHANTNFDDDLGFDPFSESIKGLADLVIEEQECKRQQQQQSSYSLPFKTPPPPIIPPQKSTFEAPNLYNSCMHQNTYLHYNRLREYSKAAISAFNNGQSYPPPQQIVTEQKASTVPFSQWPVGPPPGFTSKF